MAQAAPSDPFAQLSPRLTGSAQFALAESASEADAEPLPEGVDPEVAKAYAVFMSALRGCTLTFALSPYFASDSRVTRDEWGTVLTMVGRYDRDYRLLAEQLASAAKQSRVAYRAAKPPLMSAGRPDEFRRILNAVSTAAALFPADRMKFRYVDLREALPALIGTDPIGRLQEHAIRTMSRPVHSPTAEAIAIEVAKKLAALDPPTGKRKRRSSPAPEKPPIVVAWEEYVTSLEGKRAKPASFLAWCQRNGKEIPQKNQEGDRLLNNDILAEIHRIREAYRQAFKRWKQ